MQEVYLLAIAVLLCILLIVFARYKREGFEGEATTHDGLNKKHQRKYNRVGAALVAKGNEHVLGSESSALFGSVVTNLDALGKETNYIDDPYPLEGDKSGLYADIQMCERVTTTDCSIFDNENFAKKCGICMDFGKNSMGKPATGGLTLIEKDKKYYKDNHTGDGIPNYVPTVGSCPAKRMVSNKSECLRLKKQIECEKNSTFNSPNGCSLCYSDSSYHIVDPKEQPGLFVGAGTLYIVGAGILTFSEVGQSDKRKVNLSKLTNPFRVELMGPEMTNITLDLKKLPVAAPYDPTYTYDVDDVIFFNGNVYNMVEGANAPGYAPDRVDDKLWQLEMKEQEYVEPPPAYIAGVLTGTTGNSGTFTFDLFRLILTDTISGRKPRTGGPVTLKPGDADEVEVTKMVPSQGKKNMKMIARSPFTFLDTTTDEAAMCPSSPFVTKQASAEFLQADPCYRKGMGPGKFSLECLQNIFLTNGCEESGKGYPTTAGQANAVMFNSSGTPLTLSQVSDLIYTYAVASSTGVSSEGKKLNIKEWSDASVFCTGKAITSPCDTETKQSGPLSKECIIYLWDNQGDNKELATSYASSLSRSLFGKGNTPRFCNRSGTLSPLTESGKENLQNINFWMKQGGVNSLKSKMSQIHTDANSSVIPEKVKAEKIRQCYGLVPGERPSFTSSYTSDSSVQMNPPPPPPPKPVTTCLGGLTYVKLGEFKLGYIDSAPCDNIKKPQFSKDGWIFVANRENWANITDSHRNETWAHVQFTAKDLNGVNVINIVNKVADKFNIPERVGQQPQPWINYYIKFKTSNDSSVVLNKCGRMVDIGCRQGAMIGMYMGNNWSTQYKATNGQYVVDMLTGGEQKPVGNPIMGDNEYGDSRIYELYFALTTDTGCIASSGTDNSKPGNLPSSVAPAVTRNGPGWNF